MREKGKKGIKERKESDLAYLQSILNAALHFIVYVLALLLVVDVQITGVEGLRKEKIRGGWVEW